MRDFLRKARPLAVAAATAVLLVACSDDDPSGPAFGAETANQVADAAEDVIAPIETTAEVQANLSNVMFSLGFGGVLSAQPYQMIERFRSRSPFQPIGPIGPILVPSAPTGVLIPEEYEGTTFVWDLDSAKYVASELEGAPANGARFLWYAVDGGGNPAAPLNALGHIDLIDESTETKARLEIVAVRDQGNVTLADYFVEGSATSNLSTTTATVDAEGYFSDGTDRLDFDMRLVLDGNEEASTQEYTMELDGSDGGSIDVHFEETHDEAGEVPGAVTADGSFTINARGSEAVFAYSTSGTLAGMTIDGALTFNGEEVVVVSGDADNPTFAQPDGDPLTQNEMGALIRMWAAAGMTMLFALQTLFPFLLLLALA